MARYAATDSSAVGNPLRKLNSCARGCPEARTAVTMRSISETSPRPSLMPATVGMSSNRTAAAGDSTALARWYTTIGSGRASATYATCLTSPAGVDATRYGGSSSRPAAPTSAAAAAKSRACCGPPPVPAYTGSRPSATRTAVATTSRYSVSDSAVYSPVPQATNSPDGPAATWLATCSAYTSRSTLSSGVNGVSGKESRPAGCIRLLDYVLNP